MSDPLGQQNPQEPYVYQGPYHPPKRRKLGCVGWGCIIMVVLFGIMIVLFGGASYFAFTSFENVATGKADETPVYEGTKDEKAALQKKLNNLQDSFSKGELNTETFSANEINMMIALSPPEMNLKHHVFVSMEENQLKTDAAVPLNMISSWLGNATMSVTIIMQPTIKDGKVEFVFKSIKAKDHQLDDATMKQVNDAVNDKVNDAISQNPDSAKTLSHIKSVVIENNQLSITTQ
jgi:hypothetical protein